MLVDIEEQYITAYRNKGAILFNMTLNGKRLGAGETLIPQRIHHQIRDFLHLPFNHELLL